MKRIKEIEKAWNTLGTDEQRWKYLLAHKNEIGLGLDNDGTYARFHSSVIPDEIEDLDDLPDLNNFYNYVGWSDGVVKLFESLGIEAEPV